MKNAQTSEVGYAFALPRLVARLAGREARRAELCRWEAYGLGILIFGIYCVGAARFALPFVRPGLFQLLLLLLVPVAVWIALLPVYYVNARLAALLCRLGLHTGPTNNPVQHFVIMTLTTVFALLFLRDECDWIKALGIFWFALFSCNLLAIGILKFRHEP